MQITFDISELEIDKVKTVMNRLYMGEADAYFDWRDPEDVAQAVKDAITEALE